MNSSYKKLRDNKTIMDFWNTESGNGHLCKPKGVLYHYTSSQAFVSILQNKEFWLTKSGFMNDVQDIQYAKDLFIERLNISKMKKDNKDALIENLKVSVRDGLFDNIFVLSLSADGDSLPLWSYYGKNDGYNIGIKPEFIEDCANANLMTEKILDSSKGGFVERKSGLCVSIEHNTRFSYSTYGNYILYDRDTQEKIFDLYIEELINLYGLKSHKADQEARLLISDIIQFIPFMKHSSYINEKEYRMLFKLDKPSVASDSPIALDKIQKYRLSTGAMVTDIVVKLNKPGYFNSVTISPFNHNEFTEAGIIDLTNNYVYKLEFIPSNIPSRF